MPNALPIELRERVVRAYEAGEGSFPVIARQFSIGEATVKRWVWLTRAQGSVTPRRRGGGNFSTIAESDIEIILELHGDATAGELTAEYNRRRRGRARVHVSSMKRALRRYGYVVKKNADGRWRVCARTSKPNAQHS